MTAGQRTSLARRRRRLTWLGSALALPLLAVVAWVLWPLPPSLLTAARGDGIVVEDRNGLPLRATRAADGSRARWAAYDEIDPDLINAFVAVEDRRFWDHPGVDALASGRAVWSNLRARRVVSGASTITMQLARLLRPADRDWTGKLAQTLWALRLERHLGKQAILAQYLNRVQLGQATAGVAAASALYFGAAPSELSVGQAALLAGIAHAPSRDNPIASPARARARRSVALGRMQRLGYVAGGEVARARDEPLVTGTRATPFLAPHFAAKVVAWAAESERTGAGRVAGGRLRTSLDLRLQETLEAEVRHTVEMLRGRGVEHAAAVVLDNATGEVLAWVGSPDFWAADGQTDMVVSLRQPGSALKPFLYALAFDRGYTAASVLPDVPKSYATTTGVAYHPRNYDRRFRGPVRAREALASSYNVPAVELADRLGAASLLRTLHLAGFTSLRQDAEHYGLGLALGNGDVSLIELANGYRALANGGEWRPWTGVMGRFGNRGSGAAVLDTRFGNGVRDGERRRVVSPMASALVLDVLRDPAARIPGFGTSTPFEFPFPVAVKTGTSRHFTDNWAVGTTQGFTVAVWAGNFSGRPMEGVSGITGAGPLLHRAVMAAAERVAPGAFPTPGELGAVSVPVCRLSGLRAATGCAYLAEWFAPGTEPTRVDDWEAGGSVTLPDEYADWARSGLRLATTDGASGGLAPQVVGSTPAPNTSAPNTELPDAEMPNATAPNARRLTGPAARAARFRIVSPLDGDRYAIPPGIEARYATIRLRAAGPGAERVEWSVDGQPYEQDRWPLAPGSHVVRAVSVRGETTEVRFVVER